MNLPEPAQQFITHLKALNRSKKTLELRTSGLAMFFNYLAAQNITGIDAVTKETIREYQVELCHTVNRTGQPNSVSYQNNLLRAVVLMFRFLKDHGYIVADPGAGISYARQPQTLPRSVLTPTEARKIIHAPDIATAMGYRDRTILEILYSTGIRREEVHSLTLNDVDYHDGFLRIANGKGGKDRIVPLGRIACRYLENYIKSVRPELIRNPYNNHLFLSLRGNRMSRNLVWKLVKKYARQAKIKKNVHPHTFRHTCATVMLRNRADLRAVQELLGHASLESTQVYTHLSITDLKDVHQRCHPREQDRE
jgi:integrase/recombinase XerD